MRKSVLSLCLSIVIATACLFGTGYGLAEDASGLYLYQGIPVKDTTPEIVSKILLEKKGVPFETSSVVWSGNAYGIEEFGYEWNLQLDFNENDIGMNRLLLSSAQSARVSPDDFRNRIQSDLGQFVDVESRLTALYGEPDNRFFYVANRQSGKSERVMFPSGRWETEPMTSVCEKERWFQSFSVWGNVVLQSWVDWKKPNVAGEYLSRVMLYYYPDMQSTAAIKTAAVGQYPSAGED